MSERDAKAITLAMPVKVRLPAVPNFLTVQTHLGGSTSVRLADVSDDHLKAIAEEWTAELLAKAERQRNEPMAIAREAAIED